MNTVTCVCLVGAFLVLRANGELGETAGRYPLENDKTYDDPVKRPMVPPYMLKLVETMQSFQPKSDDSRTAQDMGGLLMGWPGIPGKPGQPGRNGLNGLLGPKGDEGKIGPVGPTGPSGPIGPAGLRGAPGRAGKDGKDGKAGKDGRDGRDGQAGKYGHAVWKQCAWSEESDLDDGVIKVCYFNKTRQDTFLKVSFTGNLRVGGCTNCCKRWFFTFNMKECASPLPIDAAIFVLGPNYANPLRPRHIEGYCHVPDGRVAIGFHIGKCKGFGLSDGFTGWNSVSRIVVQEVPPPQE